MKPENTQYKTPDIEVAAIINALERGTGRDRTAAYQRLDEMGPEAIAPLLAELDSEWHIFGKYKRKRRARFRSLFLTGLAVALLILGCYSLSTFDLRAIWLWVFAWLVFARLPAALSQTRLALSGGQNDRTHATILALIYVLESLRAGDANRLDDRQRARLCGLLANCSRSSSVCYDAELAVAVLGALEQVGDSCALPFVMVLAQDSAERAVHPFIYKAARECLPALRERVEQERISSTLLRPANAPDNPAEVLLRPARGVAETDPQQLLRPAELEEK